MGWFGDLCRNLGLMVHNIRHPEGDSRKQIVKKEVEEERQGNMILRRTTIEEVEIRPDEQSDEPKPND